MGTRGKEDMKILIATFIPWIVYFCFVMFNNGDIGAQLGVFLSPFITFMVMDEVLHPK